MRRVVRLLALAPPYAALQATHWLGFALDEVIFPGYRRTEPDTPLFIVGIPRSGTTFVHRTLAQDSRFTSMAAWEAVLAPSISERKAWEALAGLDQRLGAPIAKVLLRLLRNLAAQLDDVHPIAPDDAEEDYLALLPVAGCFLLALGFPDADALWALADLEEGMDSQSQETLLDAYHAVLQRHLYIRGGSGQPAGAIRLLSKNAAFATWTPALARRYPDARFIVCMRDPIEALSSQLSSIESARQLFGTDPDGVAFPQRFGRLYASGLRSLRKAVEAAPHRFAVVDMETLKRRPGTALRSALSALGEPMSPALEQALSQADHHASGYQSPHHHDIGQFDLATESLRRELQSDYHAICTHLQAPWQEVS
ncbi:MAG: sulfotransferase [Abyssibacter sp.]|uniref:sulfotransferase n=1 Tax=Abyssibacter sp. TaxID=2320200 RepID=UPI00321AC5DC